jgi:hypothetical protein
MARLIEFFTKPGELVLDPFAGVGGTLLGAAICRSPRRALGFEIEPRWADVYEVVARRARPPAGAELATWAGRPGRPTRPFDPSFGWMVGDALELLRRLDDASVDFVATDPPYNPQLKLTMAGGRWPRRFANRRTDYAMVTDPGRPGQQRHLRRVPHDGGRVRPSCGGCCATGRYATIIVRDAYQQGRYRFTGRPRGARRAGRLRDQGRPGLVPGRHAAAAVRLPAGFVPNIVHQHILVLRAG